MYSRNLAARGGVSAVLLTVCASAQGSPIVRVPNGNPMTTERVLLGKALFWDGRAGERFYDPANPSVVVRNGKAALESQAAGAPVSDIEMSHVGRVWTDIAARVAVVESLALVPNIPGPLAAFVAGRDCPALFNVAFGSADVTSARIAMAIATYERTLVSADSPFDRGR